MKILNISAAMTVMLLAGLFYLPHAQSAEPHSHHGMAPATTAATPTSSPSTAAYTAANAKMHQGMAISFTGDADRDFLAGMIAHHQGAVDMSEVVLEYGKDPKVRKLAKAIIRAQKQEIAQMQRWLDAMEKEGGKAAR